MTALPGPYGEVGAKPKPTAGKNMGWARPGGGGGTAGGGFDLGATAMGGILDLLNGGGRTYSPGSSGGMISRAPQRAAAQQAYNQAEADRGNVYGQAVSAVRERNPAIIAGYDKGTQDLQANARARAIADRSAATQQDADFALAAQRMGLDTAPPATDTRADAVREGNIGQYQTNADSWQGFNDSTKQRAVERNDAVGDAFVWQGDQQRQALAQMLMQALSGMQDTYYAGSAGGWSGGLKPNQQLQGYSTLLNFSDKDFDNDLNAAKFQQATAPIRRR